MATRQYAWQPVDRDRPLTYALKNYAMLATSADKGAVRDRAVLDGASPHLNQRSKG